MRRYLRRLVLLAAVLAAAVGALYLIRVEGAPLRSYLDIRGFFEKRDALLAAVSRRLVLASLLYVLVYLGVAALSIPGASLLSIMGGFFFGALPATLYINAGATLGAFVVFLAARYFIGDMVQSRYGDRLRRFNREMEENGPYYLLTLRLVPVFPFFLINLFAGVTRIRPATFLWTTSAGIVPGSFAYAYLGHSVADLDLRGGVPAGLVVALLILAALSLIPVAVKKLRARRGPGAGYEDGREAGEGGA
jgi:uncharacterized membrane protein YdjX (TVP38/TMEM64 family)